MSDLPLPLPGRDLELDAPLPARGSELRFRGRRPSTGQQLRVELLPVDPAPAAARFLERARLLVELRHPAAPTVIDLGRAEKVAFLITACRDTVPLAELLRRPSAALVSSLGPTFAAVAELLAYAHARGIYHGDLGPDAIELGPHGEVEVSGWRGRLDDPLASDPVGGEPHERQERRRRLDLLDMADLLERCQPLHPQLGIIADRLRRPRHDAITTAGELAASLQTVDAVSGRNLRRLRLLCTLLGAALLVVAIFAVRNFYKSP